MVSGLRRPTDSETLFIIGLGDDVEMNVINFLMCQSPIILKNIVVNTANSLGYSFGDRKDISEAFIGQLGHFGSMEFGNDQLKTLFRIRVSVSRAYRMSGAQWIDIKECKSMDRLVQLVTRNGSLDNLAKDAAFTHGQF